MRTLNLGGQPASEWIMKRLRYYSGSVSLEDSPQSNIEDYKKVIKGIQRTMMELTLYMQSHTEEFKDTYDLLAAKEHLSTLKECMDALIVLVHTPTEVQSEQLRNFLNYLKKK